MNNYSFSDPKVLEQVAVMERYEPVEDGITFDWPAAGVKVRLQGSGKVVFRLHVEQINFKHDVWDQYFKAFVDGVEQDLMILEAKDGSPFDVTLNVGETGVHTVWFMRSMERCYGGLILHSVSFAGELLNQPEGKVLMEVVGDSITCAGASNKEHDVNTTGSYAFLSALRCGYDWRIVANSGWGLKYCSSGEQGIHYGWADAYDLENDNRSETKPYTCRRQADLVLINLGANDTHSRSHGGPAFTDEEFADYGVELINKIRRYQPDATVVWLVGGISQAYRDGATRCIEKMGGEANRCFLFDFHAEYHSGTCWHPSGAEHKILADALTAWLKDNETKLLP